MLLFFSYHIIIYHNINYIKSSFCFICFGWISDNKKGGTKGKRTSPSQVTACLASTVQLRDWIYMGVSKNRRKTPKMDGL